VPHTVAAIINDALDEMKSPDDRRRLLPS
jgi:hypothetical protein